MWQGYLANARRCYLEALALRRGLGNQPNISVTLGFTGDALCLDGEYPEALALYEESLALSRAVGARLAVARTQSRIGYLFALQGDAAQAAQRLAESLAVLRESEHHFSLIYCFMGYAVLSQLRQHWVRSVWLLAFARSTLSMSIARPSFRIRLERAVIAARAALEPAAFEAAWAEGGQLTLEQALALALEES